MRIRDWSSDVCSSDLIQGVRRMRKSFEQRVVLVTGGAAGLGRCFAEHFAAEGARLILLDIDEKGLEQTAAILRERGSECAVHRVEFAVESQIRQVAAKLCAQHPRRSEEHTSEIPFLLRT